MTEPLTPAAGSRIMPNSLQGLVDELGDMIGLDRTARMLPVEEQARQLSRGELRPKVTRLANPLVMAARKACAETASADGYDDYARHMMCGAYDDSEEVRSAVMAIRIFMESGIDAARNRGDHETAEKWEMQLRADGSARVGV